MERDLIRLKMTDIEDSFMHTLKCTSKNMGQNTKNEYFRANLSLQQKFKYLLHNKDGKRKYYCCFNLLL